MRVRRRATLWDVERRDLEWERTGPHSIQIFEPLPVKLGPGAVPYCCYLSTVIFYAPGKLGIEELARCEYKRFNDLSPHLLHVPDLGWVETQGARVMWRRDRWYVVYSARDNTRDARGARGYQESWAS